MQKWQDARFGMFIHWGPVSLKGTEIGWSRGARVPTEEYDNLYKQFNPTKFNADEWVAVAKAAGMKYMVLTTKHHDGSSWVTFHKGSRLGAHFNASFSPVTTSAIRLNILDATKGVTISEIFIQAP
ncbi:MAG: alpha-L-fucosidase [Akkermansiaceae bacterium]|nr:alpha-L-fucosidase [Akkermansiaceae bacterium]